MSVARRLEWWKRWAPVLAVTTGGAVVLAVVMVLVRITLAVLVLRDASAAAGARRPAVAAAQTPADWGPGAQAAPYQGPADPTAAQVLASEMSPAPQLGTPDEAEDSTPSSVEQRAFRSRRALETIDPRELLRQAGGQKEAGKQGR